MLEGPGEGLLGQVLGLAGRSAGHAHGGNQPVVVAAEQINEVVGGRFRAGLVRGPSVPCRLRALTLADGCDGVYGRPVALLAGAGAALTAPQVATAEGNWSATLARS